MGKLQKFRNVSLKKKFHPGLRVCHTRFGASYQVSCISLFQNCNF